MDLKPKLIAENLILTILMQQRSLGHSTGTSSNSQHSGHCKPMKTNLISKD